MTSFFLSAIRLLFALGSSIRPDITGKIAFRLFCTPRQSRTKNKKTLERIKSGEQVMAKAKQVSLDTSCGKIAVYDFYSSITNNTEISNTKPESNLSKDLKSVPSVALSKTQENHQRTVILVHGFQSRAIYMSGFIEPLIDQGYRVLVFDLPGHGLSQGSRCHVPIAVEALQAVYVYAGSCHAMVTHSLGGVITATLLARTIPAFSRDIAVARLVLISSPNSVPRLFQDYIDMVGLRGKAIEVFFSMINRLSQCQPEDFITANQIKQTQTPTLVLHAPDDKEVPFSDAEEITEFNPKAILKVIPNKGHRRIVWSSNTIEEAIKFIALAD